MYKSPIDVIYQDINRKFENGIISAVQKCDINVDKDELVRALQYDREQYEKGYADGRACARWIPCEERLPEDERRVLCTVQSGEHYCVVPCIFIQHTRRWLPEVYGNHDNVLAWMPLPEPYKGGEG